jgi:hypothetical protein
MHIPHETKATVSRARTILFILVIDFERRHQNVNDLRTDVEWPKLAGTRPTRAGVQASLE